MLEEMSSLVRRVDGLEEKLRIRASGCEELVRQKTRELEQQVHSLQQKSLLASSTSEEMSKRHTTRLRKLGQAMEEHAQRLASVEDAARRPMHAPVDTVHWEARMLQLERQLAGHEDDLRSLTQSAEARNGEMAATAMLSTDLRQGAGGSGRGGDEDNFDSMLRALEREVSNLSQRLSSQLDEHSVGLANLRVRSDGQEQRLAAASERLETVVNPPLEALRVEVTQLREHDRIEMKAQLEHLAKSVQAAMENTEESATELRGKIGDLRAELQSLEPRTEDHHPMIQKLADSHGAQEQAIRRLEAMVVDMPRHGAGQLSEELCGTLVRLDAMEHRLECLEQAGSEEELAEKADRSEVTRIDAALQELSEPLRRLSQRTASNENRTVALERRVEQLQQFQGTLSTSSQPQVRDRMEELSAAAAGPSMDAIADLTARVIEIESLLEHGRSLDASTALPVQSDSDGAGLHALRSHVAELSEQVSQIRSRSHDLPSSSGDQADQGSRTLQRLSASEEATRALQQQFHQLQSDHRKLESSAACGSGHEERISFLEKATRDVQQHVQEAAATRPNAAQEQRLAGLEASSRALQEDLQEVRRQARELSHSSALSADHEDRFLSLEQQWKAAEKRIVSLEGSVKTIGPQLQQDLQALAERLRGEQADLSRSAAQSDDGKLADRLSELAGRVEESERQLAEVRGQLEEPVQVLGERMARLSEAHAQVEQRQKAEGERVDDALRRATSSEEALKELQEQQEEQLKAVQSRLEKPMQALREQLEKLSESHAELEQRHTGGGDLAERVSDAVERAVSSEKALKAMQEQHDEQLREVRSLIDEPVRSLQERVEQLSKSRAEQEGRQSGDADAASRVDDAFQRIADSEKALKALQEQHEERLKEVQSQLEEPMRALQDQLAALSKSHAEQEGRQSTNADVAARIDDALQRIASSEKALKAVQEQQEQQSSDKDEAPSPELIADLSRRVAAGEEGARLLRSDLRVAEASVKDALAQLERLATQVESVEAARPAAAHADAERGAGGAVAGLGAELEKRVQEMQQQVSEELSCLMRHQKDLLQAVDGKKQSAGDGEQTAKALPGPVSEEMERTVADFSRQVASELQDLQEHQQELRKVKDLLSSLPSKASTTEHDKAGGETSGAGADQASLNKLEATVEGLSKQVAMLATEKGAEVSDDLKQQLQKLQSNHEELSGNRIQMLEKRMEQLRSDHDELSNTKLLGGDFVDRVSDVMQRLKGGEDKIAAVEKQLEQPIKALDSRLDQLRSDYEALKQTKVLHSDLTGRISDVLQRLESSEEAIAALQKRPASAGPLDGPSSAVAPPVLGEGGAAAGSVEAQVRELQQKVTEELHFLEKHQRELAAAGSAPRGGGPGVALSASAEAQIREFQRKVTEELQCLEKHQRELALAGSKPGGEGSGSAVTASIEAQIRELQRQVTDELHCLEKHQGDLAMAGSTSKRGGAGGHAADALPGAAGGDDVEQAVSELSRQVAAELQDLREHQQDLGRVRTAVLALKSQPAPEQIRPNGHAPSDANSQKRLPQHLELQIEDLSRQVSSELQALAGQQAELGQTKATLGGLAKQVKDVTDGLAKCDTTCISLRQQLDECRANSAAGSRSSPIVGLAAKSAGSSSGGGKPVGKNASLSSGRGRRRGGSAEADSDQSDTYQNEFEESIGEESISESR